MTLPSSGSISTTQIRTEIGGSGSVVIPSAEVRTLTGVASGSVVLPNDFYGKSSLSPAPSGTVLYDSGGGTGGWSYTHSSYAGQTITVEVWGGGGSGATSFSGGKAPVVGYWGGGGAGYSKSTYSIANGGTVSGSVGAGGAAAGSANVNGNVGGNSTCSQTGQTANGGGGGVSGSSGGSGGGASGGNVANTSGETGGAVSTPSDLTTSYGGSSPNGGARSGYNAVGNYPGGGSCPSGNAGAVGRVLVKAA